MNLYHLFSAVAANLYYGFPSRKLKIVGVTGTDGKTTTVTLIFKILQSGGKKVAMVSTVEAFIGGQSYDTGFHVTSPDPWALQKFIRRMVDEDCEYAVLEVTSHALDQHRVWGIHFDVGVVTNVTRDHFDYHGTYENYLKAKAKLLLASGKIAINADDQSYRPLINFLQAYHRSPELTYDLFGKAEVTLVAGSLKESQSEAVPTKFICRVQDDQLEVSTWLRGQYNYANILAAIGAVKALGISDEATQAGIVNFSGVEGRWQKIELGQDFVAILDFAHTPNALEVMLKNCRAQMPKEKKLAVVFGCAGLRDVGKRQQMGVISGRLADWVVLTAEDPRTEDVNAIIDQIAVGCEETGCRNQGLDSWADRGYFRIPDRQSAIEFALTRLAKSGDWVVVTGKGHEKSMCYGTSERLWSDKEEMERALRMRLGANLG
ncbi:MAG: UDP-N-acetylmuramoyl-L-alanyl-D-glutamate--2,6-diaminopimelate ligase [bacterium]|nr:UDP-N-acetylmuramoyl-L-alanyl-D-glutamate--2,6-diaminopimelate ligase [bacterium]